VLAGANTRACRWERRIEAMKAANAAVQPGGSGVGRCACSEMKVVALGEWDRLL
jgi:hypothetical protein